VTEDGFWLGSWVVSQKVVLRGTVEQRAKLETLVGWEWEIKDASWEAGLYALNEFALREGHTMIPMKYVTPEGIELGKWVATQRANISRLTPEQKDRLKKISGWF
jgi:hypothetical protein